MSNPFKKASLSNARVRLNFSAQSKAGKTYKTLSVATTLISSLKKKGKLVGNGRIAMIDSEHGSALVYAGQFDFDHVPVMDFSPETYIDLLNCAEENKYSVVAIDGISHEWTGGILPYHNNMTETMKDSFRAWGRATPKHQAFIDAMIRHPSHLIVTMRQKTKYAMQRNGEGRSEVRKIGLRPIQRNDTEYEFDAVGTIDQNHVVTFGGTRYPLLSNRSFTREETDLIGEILADWVSGTEQSEVMKQMVDIRPESLKKIESLREEVGIGGAAWTTVLSRYGAPKVELLTERNAQGLIRELSAKASKNKANV